MRRPARQFGILVLAVALVPGQLSTADAGVIPWLYDAVFGPVGHYGYGGYSNYGYRASYGNPYYGGYQVGYYAPSSYYRPTTCGPAGCSTAACGLPCGRVVSSARPCATGGCSTVITGYRYSPVNCGSCAIVASSGNQANSTCDAKTEWKSQEAKTEWKTEVLRGEAEVPTPTKVDVAPRPKTFADEPVDPGKGLNTVDKAAPSDAVGASASNKPKAGDPNWNSTGKPATSTAAASGTDADAVEVGKAVAEPAAESAGFGDALREGETSPTGPFIDPVKGAEPAAGESAVPTATPLLPGGLDGQLKLDAVPGASIDSGINTELPLELQNKSSWNFSVPVQRIAFRAGFRNAKLARSTVSVKADYVIPSAVTMRLVSR